MSGHGKGALYWSRVTKRKYFSGCVVVLIIIIWNGRCRSRTRDLETMEETADYHCSIPRELLSKRDKVGILSLYPSFCLSVFLCHTLFFFLSLSFSLSIFLFRSFSLQLFELYIKAFDEIYNNIFAAKLILSAAVENKDNNKTQYVGGREARANVSF